MLLGLVGLSVLMFDRARLRNVASSLLLMGAAVAIGGLGFVMLDGAVSKMTGRVATPPPFLLARVIEDGPGTSYLRQACAEEHYVVCRFVDRMPIPVRDFLWSKEPERGVWYVVPPEDRARLAQEQYAIVLRSFLHAPLIQTTAIASNFARQMINFSVVEFGVGGQLRQFIAKSFKQSQVEPFMESRVAQDRIDLNTLSVLYYLAVLGSMVLLLRFHTLDRTTRAVIAIVLAGVVLNALVTGTVSTPDQRFRPA